MSPEDRRPDPRLAKAALLGLAAACAVLHLAFAGRYGYFRDEFYYIACARRLAWGYVDQPPLIAVLTRFALFFGTSAAALRTLPILAGAATVFVTGALARELGGGRRAQILAALCVLLAPVLLFLFHVLTMNAFDVLLSTASFLLFTRILKGADPRRWLALGLLLGLGLLTKISAGVLGAGFFAGLLLTGARSRLRSPWPWAGAALALALFLPHVVWQVKNGWPTLEFIRNAAEHKNVRLNPLAYLLEVAFLAGPLAAPVWAAGFAGFFGVGTNRVVRPVGIALVTVFAVYLSGGAKPYYVAFCLPALFAAGSTLLERVLSGRERLGSGTARFASGMSRRFSGARRPVVLFVYTGVVAASGLALLPLTIPVLPVDRLIRYQQSLGMEASSGERDETGPLPQIFADMFGWPEMVAAVADTWRKLPESDRADCAIFGQNYGEAGAIDFLGSRFGLPPAISAHNNYYLWGPRGYTGRCMIVINGQRDDLERYFESVEPGTAFDAPLAMPHERSGAIFVCRRLRSPLAEAWPRLKHFE